MVVYRFQWFMSWGKWWVLIWELHKWDPHHRLGIKTNNREAHLSPQTTLPIQGRGGRREWCTPESNYWSLTWTGPRHHPAWGSSLTRWENGKHAQDHRAHGEVGTGTLVHTTGLQPCLGRVLFLGHLGHARSIRTECSYKRGQMLAQEVPFWDMWNQVLWNRNALPQSQTDPFSSLKRLQRQAGIGEKARKVTTFIDEETEDQWG